MEWLNVKVLLLVALFLFFVLAACFVLGNLKRVLVFVSVGCCVLF
jgi:hypothetical protein